MATKNARTILASQSLATTTSVNGTELNESTDNGLLVCGLVTNGATGPTVGTTMFVYVGEATGKKRLWQSLTHSNFTNNAAQDLVVLVPPEAMFVNVTFTNGDGTRAVTVECYAQELTTPG